MVYCVDTNFRLTMRLNKGTEVFHLHARHYSCVKCSSASWVLEIKERERFILPLLPRGDGLLVEKDRAAEDHEDDT